MKHTRGKGHFKQGHSLSLTHTHGVRQPMQLQIYKEQAKRKNMHKQFFDNEDDNNDDTKHGKSTHVLTYT